MIKSSLLTLTKHPASSFKFVQVASSIMDLNATRLHFVPFHFAKSFMEFPGVKRTANKSLI